MTKTRIEEIDKGFEEANLFYNCDGSPHCQHEGFKAGAQWADLHPNYIDETTEFTKSDIDYILRNKQLQSENTHLKEQIDAVIEEFSYIESWIRVDTLPKHHPIKKMKEVINQLNEKKESR